MNSTRFRGDHQLNLPRKQGAVEGQAYLSRLLNGVGWVQLYGPWVYVVTKMNRFYGTRHTHMKR